MSIQSQLEAYAFRELVNHLQANNDVQNIDIMNLAGFCRNCLSKWYFAASKNLGYPMEYDDACERVYGMPYVEWKKKFQTKATEEQMALFKQNKHRHAKHQPLPTKKDDKSVVVPKKETPPTIVKPMKQTVPKPSSACCDPDGVSCAEDLVSQMKLTHSDSKDPISIRLGVLTVSDRAFNKVYDDLSGPEIVKCMDLFSTASNLFSVVDHSISIVPDESEEIQKQLIELCKSNCNLILTNGGTGLSKRDVTPESTKLVLDKEIPGITEAIRRETSRTEPMAMLSRAIAGIRGKTLIINLPGRPKAVREALGVIMPIIHHAVAEVEK